MARIAILLPRDDMLQPAQQMAELYRLDVSAISAVHTSTVLERAQKEIAAGAEIIIARGIQAMLIKQNTAVPVVEVQLTGQEVALLVTKAKHLAKRKKPTIGLVGFKNMFCDLSSFDMLLDVSLKTYFTEDPAQMAAMALQAIEDGVEVLIGGEVVCGCAAEHQIPSVFITSGSESIGEACRITQHIAYAMDVEKRNTAEFKAILDYTVNGIVQITAEGTVSHLNHAAAQMLDKTEAQAMGQSIWKFIPSLDEKLLAPVLQKGEEIYSVRLKLGKADFLASVAPVLLDEGVVGAIISFNEGRQVELYASEQRRELLLAGHSAPFTFDTIIARSPKTQSLLEQGKRFAKFSLPVLLRGEFGTEKEELAQCIHNASAYAGNAFVSINCGGYTPEEVEERLFGSDSGGRSLVEKAQGILFLNEVSRLSPTAQYKIYCIIARRANSSFGGLEDHTVPLRILAADSRDLAELVGQGEFREDLYYALSVMSLTVPPLRERRDDIQGWAELFWRELQKRHNRYIQLTKDAWKALAAYDWPGNLAQLRNFCERVMVEAPRRTVDEVVLNSVFGAAFPPVRRQSGQVELVYCDPKAAHIAELLNRHGGNRSAVALEMGISTTTLWRHMKKYRIEKSGRKFLAGTTEGNDDA